MRPSGQAAVTPRLLLKALLCCPGRQARREALLEMLWPDADPEQAIQYLNTATTKLRKVLQLVKGQASLLITEDDYQLYRLEGQSLLWTDVDEVLALLNEAEQRERTSIETLPLLERAAEHLGHGTLLEEEGGTWVSGRRATVDRIRYRCRIWLSEAYIQHGRMGQAETVLNTLLEEDPTDEDILCRLMNLLHQQGMTHQAIRLYEDTCKALAKEGVELTEAIKHLAIQLREERPSMQDVVVASAPITTHPVLPQKPASLLSSASEQHNASPLLPQLAGTMLPFNALLMPVEPALLTPSNLLLSTQPLAHLSTLAQSSSTSSEMLGHFATLTETCRHLSEGNELKIAESILWTFLPKVAFIARTSSEHQHQAAAIASQGYLLAASLVGHRNNILERLHFSELALRYGEMADDLNLQVVALRQIAISYDCMRSPDKVLETYQRTFLHLNDVSPLLCACIYADVSGAHAQLGHEQEAHRFVGMAYDHFPGQPEQEPSYLHTICRYSSLLFWDGLNHLLLNQPAEAEKAFEKIDGLHSNIHNPERNRAEVLNYQVETFVALGKMDQACTYLETAVKVARTVGSVRRFQEASVLFQQMYNVWHHEQPVQQLAELFMR